MAADTCRDTPARTGPSILDVLDGMPKTANDQRPRWQFHVRTAEIAQIARKFADWPDVYTNKTTFKERAY